MQEEKKGGKLSDTEKNSRGSPFPGWVERTHSSQLVYGVGVGRQVGR